jgi:hypothetical protein
MGLTNQDPGCCCTEGCNTGVGVFNCNTAAFVPGASVTVTGHGISISGTTGSDGELAVTLPEAGDYTIQVSGAGSQVFLQSVFLGCTSFQGAIIWLQESVTSCFEFSAVGCGGEGTSIPGAVLSIAGVTYSLPATVCLTVPTAPGVPPPPSTVFPYTVSASNYTDVTGEVTLTGNCFAAGGPVVVSMTPAAGFVCFCGGGNCPIPETSLSLTDSAYGNVTLAFSIVGGIQEWIGTLTVNYPGLPRVFDCSPQDSVTLTYTLSCTSGAIPFLEIDYQAFPSEFGNVCPAADGTPNTSGGSCDPSFTTSSFCPLNLGFTVGPFVTDPPGVTCALYPSGSTFTVTP